MIKRSEMKQIAKDSLKGNHWTAVGVSLVGTLITSVVGSTGIGSIFTPVLSFGLDGFYKDLVAKKEAKFETLFTETFNNFLKKWGTVWLVALYTFLWSLLFCIPGIIKTYSYSMTTFILLDHPEMGINEAITESRRMMNGYKWKLFVLDLSFILWRLLCMIPVAGMVLNVLYVTPYVAATRASFYEELKRVNP